MTWKMTRTLGLPSPSGTGGPADKAGAGDGAQDPSVSWERSPGKQTPSTSGGPAGEAQLRAIRLVPNRPPQGLKVDTAGLEEATV